jgi:hypothetical protein
MRRILTLGLGSPCQMYRSRENKDHSAGPMRSPAIDGKAETKMKVWNGWRVLIVCLMVIEAVAASTLKGSNGAIKAGQRGTYFQRRPGAGVFRAYIGQKAFIQRRQACLFTAKLFGTDLARWLRQYR